MADKDKDEEVIKIEEKEPNLAVKLKQIFNREKEIRPEGRGVQRHEAIFEKYDDLVKKGIPKDWAIRKAYAGANVSWINKKQAEDKKVLKLFEKQAERGDIVGQEGVRQWKPKVESWGTARAAATTRAQRDQKIEIVSKYAVPVTPPKEEKVAETEWIKDQIRMRKAPKLLPGPEIIKRPPKIILPPTPQPRPFPPVCRNCGRQRPIFADGLCAECYQLLTPLPRPPTGPTPPTPPVRPTPPPVVTPIPTPTPAPQPQPPVRPTPQPQPYVPTYSMPYPAPTPTPVVPPVTPTPTLGPSQLRATRPGYRSRFRGWAGGALKSKCEWKGCNEEAEEIVAGHNFCRTHANRAADIVSRGGNLKANIAGTWEKTFRRMGAGGIATRFSSPFFSALLNELMVVGIIFVILPTLLGGIFPPLNLIQSLACVYLGPCFPMLWMIGGILIAIALYGKSSGLPWKSFGFFFIIGILIIAASLLGYVKSDIPLWLLLLLPIIPMFTKNKGLGAIFLIIYLLLLFTVGPAVLLQRLLTTYVFTPELNCYLSNLQGGTDAINICLENVAQAKRAAGACVDCLDFEPILTYGGDRIRSRENTDLTFQVQMTNKADTNLKDVQLQFFNLTNPDSPNALNSWAVLPYNELGANGGPYDLTLEPKEVKLKPVTFKGSYFTVPSGSLTGMFYFKYGYSYKMNTTATRNIGLFKSYEDYQNLGLGEVSTTPTVFAGPISLTLQSSDYQVADSSNSVTATVIPSIRVGSESGSVIVTKLKMKYFGSLHTTVTCTGPGGTVVNSIGFDNMGEFEIQDISISVSKGQVEQPYSCSFTFSNLESQRNLITIQADVEYTFSSLPPISDPLFLLAPTEKIIVTK